MTENNSFMKLFAIVVLIMFGALLAGCRSISEQRSDGVKPQLTSTVTEINQSPTEEEQILMELEKASYTIFINDFERADFCLQKAEYCKRLLDQDRWHGQQRKQLEEFRRHFRREYHIAKTELSKQGIVKMAEDCNSLVAFMKLFARMQPVYESMLSESELWSTDEKTHLLQRKELVTQMLQSMDELLKTSVSDCQEDVWQQRKKFENKAGADYLQYAENCLKAQKNKRFNWWIFGYCRDDFHVLCDGADFCLRVHEAHYILPEMKNLAMELHDNIYQRFSKKGKRLYDKHINIMTPLENLCGYPVDHSESDGDALAWKRFCEIHDGDNKELGLGKLEIVNNNH